MPRVSVIIPVHNAARTVAIAIDSVLAQTFTDYEIIAIDNNSTDSSREVLAPYADVIKILEEPKRGPSAARNTGVRASSGELLAFLDADDWWRPTMLDRTVATLDRDPECALVYTDLALADSTGRQQMASITGARHPPTVNDMLERLWPILPSGVLMRRRAFDLAGGFPEDLIAFEDVYFWLLVREHGPFQYLPEPLAVWRFALFPDPLKPAGGQDEAGVIFERMVRDRYGSNAHHHVLARRRAPRSILGYIGLRALRDGDRAQARNAFARAIRVDPLRIKNYLRYLRTLLPDAIARALSGRSRPRPPR
jgi:Glycosyl transferase family 2